MLEFLLDALGFFIEILSDFVDRGDEVDPQNQEDKPNAENNHLILKNLCVEQIHQRVHHRNNDLAYPGAQVMRPKLVRLDLPEDPGVNPAVQGQHQDLEEGEVAQR